MDDFTYPVAAGFGTVAERENTREPVADTTATRVQGGLVDRFGRRVSYIRLSVTDRCDLRCVYCMSPETTFVPRAEILSLEELYRLAKLFMSLGTRKIRITGGEPLRRGGVIQLFEWLGRHLGHDLNELTLTTNGSRLAQAADALVAAGVRRVNVSLDSLNADRYRAITRMGDLGVVLAGIEAAAAAGLRVKINVVAMQGVNDDELSTMVGWCGERGYDLSFIEVMPIGPHGEAVGHSSFLSLAVVRARLSADWTLSDVADSTGGPARYVRVAETGCRVGFITPLSHTFCDGCNRVRVSCTGRLYTCLGRDVFTDLSAPLRASADDRDVTAAIASALAGKSEGHRFGLGDPSDGFRVMRSMNQTGG